MLNRTKFDLLAVLIGLLLIQGGCGLFAGAASMRIEVEVYKGPLSKEPELQWAELSGLVNESIERMRDTKLVVKSFSEYSEAFEGNTLQLENCKRGLIKIKDEGNCLILSSLYKDAETLRKQLEDIQSELNNINDTIKKSRTAQQPNSLLTALEPKIRVVLAEVAQVSADASAKAFSWSIGTIPGTPTDRLLRIPLVHFIVACSETGKNLSARADGLLKQMDGLDRRELPLSVQLRETEATEFIQLYDWLNAYSSFSLFLQPGTPTDRIKAVRHFFADHNWSNINTVYASGWGKGSMALIKDDIGNWNLKSFDSDPEDLLRAYKNAAITAVETAAKATKAGFSGGGAAAADKLLEVAAQYFDPPSGTSASASEINQYRLLRERTSLKLQNLVSNQKGQDTQAAEEYQKALKALKNMKPSDAEYAAQEKSVQDLKSKLITQRKETIQTIEKILDEHSEFVDLLAKGTIGK